MPPDLNKEAAIKIAKTFRMELDEILQRMKYHKDCLREAQSSEFVDSNEVIAQHILSIRDVESAIMRQGMALKYVGNPDPYPQSRNPESPVVEPTADGLKM